MYIFTTSSLSLSTLYTHTFYYFLFVQLYCIQYYYVVTAVCRSMYTHYIITSGANSDDQLPRFSPSTINFHTPQPVPIDILFYGHFHIHIPLFPSGKLWILNLTFPSTYTSAIMPKECDAIFMVNTTKVAV
jgi:hypothetical protein